MECGGRVRVSSALEGLLPSRRACYDHCPRMIEGGGPSRRVHMGYLLKLCTANGGTLKAQLLVVQTVIRRHRPGTRVCDGERTGDRRVVWWH